MDLVATAIDPLRQPPPDAWDGFVARERLTMRWDAGLLRAVSWCVQAPSSMVLVSERTSGHPVAVFYARHVGLQDPRRYARPGRVPAAGLTECRSSPMLDAGMAFADGLDDRDRQEACRAFERAVRSRAGARRHPLVYRWVPRSLLGALPVGRRRFIPQGPTMVVHNEWSDLAEYLASLPDRWPSRLERIYTDLTVGSTVRCEVVDAVDPDEAAFLADAVKRRRRRGAVPFPSLPAPYFARLNQIPGYRYLTYRDTDGRLLAVLSCYDDGEDLYSGTWGYRSEADGGRRNLYFDIYPRQVEMMIRLGRRRLVLGPALEDLKIQLGARPEPRWALLAPGATPPAGAAPVHGLPAASTTSARADRHSVLVRLARALTIHRTADGGRGGRTELALACRQCGAWSAVSVTRLGARTARYWCRRCGAAAVAEPAALRPRAELRESTAHIAHEADLREVFPEAMLAWLRSRSRRPPAAGRLDKPVVYQLYRSWDAHLAQATAAQLAELAVDGGPAPVAGLPSFAAVVSAVNGAYYRTDLAASRLDKGLSAPARAALYRRAERARRWLARHGGEYCWITQVPPGGLLSPGREAVAAAARALRAGERLDPATCDTLRAALFGMTAGPGFISLLKAYPRQVVLDAVEAYLASGARPLREEALARLAAPLDLTSPSGVTPAVPAPADPLRDVAPAAGHPTGADPR